MSGWSFIAIGLVCAAGALLFLKFVANDIELANVVLRSVERRLETARRHAERKVSDEPIEVQAVVKGA